MPTNFADVHQFHVHFGLPAPKLPVELDKDVFDFRYKFMREELTEFVEGRNEGSMAKMADALIDLVYVAMGTAVMMGIPWQLLWDEVQRKNMAKVRVDASTMEGSTRQHRFDIVKPKGWTPPDIEGLLQQFIESGGLMTGRLAPDTEGQFIVDTLSPTGRRATEPALQNIPMNESAPLTRDAREGFKVEGSDSGRFESFSDDVNPGSTE